MEFYEGLFQIYTTRRSDGEICDPFLLYCRLSDLCSASFAAKKKVQTFYAVDKRLCIFETLLKNKAKGEKELLNYYAVVSELISKESFTRLIACAVRVMDGVPPQPKAVPPHNPVPKGRVCRPKEQPRTGR